MKNLREILHLLLSGVPGFVARSDAYARFRRRLSATPKRFEPAGPLAEWRRGEDWRHRKLVFPGTGLVVEGFPGSGNSFVSNSLRDALGPEVHVTSHFHHTVQLKRALAFGVPAVVVVREPLAACTSFKSKEPGLRDGLILWRWLVYHRFVARHAAGLDVFFFDDVIEDLDLVRRGSRAVGRLLGDRVLVAKLEYRRASAERVPIGTEGWLTGRLAAWACRLYRDLRSARRA